MKLRKRWMIGVGVVVAIVMVAAIVIRVWVIPSALTGELASRFHGRAKVASWWLGRSAGVEGLSLHEGNATDSPEWLSAKRVSTDLSLLGLLRGRFAPQDVTIDGAKIRLRFNAKGDLLTRGPFSNDSPASTDPLPDVEITDAEVTLEQEGRPSMVVAGISGRLGRSADGEIVTLRSDDPAWGHWTVNGRFRPDLKDGSFRLASGPGFSTDAERDAKIPFVPPEVWEHFAPTGPIGVAVTFTLSPEAGHPPGIVTEVTLLETKTDLGSLGIVADGVTGKVNIDDGLVRMTGLSGKTLSGTLDVSGTLDFRGPAPKFDVMLALSAIDVSKTPAKWQLEEVGATGTLTGKAHLLVSLPPEGADLSGSSGEAVIKNATVQGFPVKSLSLAMHAVGTDLQFDSNPEKTSSHRDVELRSLLIASVVAFQAPVPAPEKHAEPPRIRLPASITTKIELEDVDLAKLLTRLEVLTRIKIPVPIAGHLALKADAKIPLSHLADLKDYTIKGNATLTQASIDGVDLGRVSSRFDLVAGVLTLGQLEGQLVEHPDGNASRPPPATPPLAPEAPLVPGAFRGHLRAELSPPGKLVAHFDAEQLPIGELLAPYLPRPTPVAGRLSTTFDTSAEVGKLGDARSWSAHGHMDSHQISYQGAALDAISTGFTIDQGRIDLPDLVAKLGGNPLKGRLKLDMDGTRAFSGDVDVAGWAIEHVFALIPGAPRPAPAAGLIDGQGSFVGTLNPVVVKTDGKIKVRGMAVESVPLGDMIATWATEGDEIQIKEFEARPFSGRVNGRAAIPIKPGKPIRVLADYSKIDTALLSAAIAKDAVKLTGIAGGRLTASIPAELKDLKVDLTLNSPSLSVQGIPTGKVSATIVGKGDVLEYELTADGPEGKIRFKGDLPLTGNAEDRAANAALQAAGFTLHDVWSLLGIKGAPAELLGRAAIDANLRARQDPSLALGLHGNVEVRDLRWGQIYPLGTFRGVLAKSPTSFRLDAIRGELLGGAFSGVVWGETPVDGPPGMNFELQTDRAVLARVFSFSPILVKRLDGFATVRASGRMAETLRATAHVSVSHAKFSGVPLSELRIPAELSINPATGNGVLQARNWSARIAGGRVQGSGGIKVGLDRSFNVDLGLTDVDVGTFARIESNAARPGSGKITGRISINGPDPALIKKFRGRIELTLSDASLGDFPVIRELGRFLGAAQGGAFEAGNMVGTIGNGQIDVDQLTLQGRIIQIHASGSVTVDGGLDLAVLVNTNQLIPQTGQALLSIIPGLGRPSNRNEEATLRVSNFLSNRLLKFRVGGTLKNPNVALDPGVVVGQAATGFFAGVLKLPLGLVK